MTVLEAEGLSRSFGGVAAVRDVSFALAAGEMLALIGPNGAGKSTLFNLVGGQFRPDRGAVRLRGRLVTGRGPREVWREGVGRTFQVAATFGSMTVRENVQVGLLDQADRGAGVLAYGDGKRLELALALAHRPFLLLMDEPTAGMAPGERGALMALVRGLATTSGVAVLFTEHDVDVVFGTADRVLVLDRGTLIAEGPPAAVRADRRVREVYLGSDEQ